MLTARELPELLRAPWEEICASVSEVCVRRRVRLSLQSVGLLLSLEQQRGRVVLSRGCW